MSRLAQLRRWEQAGSPALLVVHPVGEFDADRERRAMRDAETTARRLVSLRIRHDLVLIGPTWTPNGAGPCAGCVEAQALVRTIPDDGAGARSVADRARRSLPSPRPSRPADADRTTDVPTLLTAELVTEVLRAGLADGELVTVSARGLTRSRVARTFRCAVCSDGGAIRAGAPDEPPPPLEFPAVPAAAGHPTRERDVVGIVQRARAATAGARFGHIARSARLARAPFAVSQVDLAAGTPAGFGRGRTAREADDVALLEAYERLAGYPHVAPLVMAATRAQLGARAVDPSIFGRHSEQQLRSPLCRVVPCADDTPIDWSWAHRIGSRAETTSPFLLPAEIAFPWYRNENGRRCFVESSSGTALGASTTEATLNAVLELVERDAFLRCWHRARPLVEIEPASIDDPVCRLLRNVCEREGFDVHLLVAASDLAIPVVWALAVNRDGVAPASFSAAGADPDPVRAVRSALWEVAQQAGGGLRWEPRDDERLADDPWLVDSVKDHWRRYTVPRLLPRVRAVLGGDRVSLRDAFGDWPATFLCESNGNLRDALLFVVRLLADVGCDQVFAVDQTTPDHAAGGMSVVRAIVPGLLPLTFGQAHQRFLGLDRLAADENAGSFPFDPHPFP